MFYKPKYCCNCGEEVENTDRKIVSSSRFCDICSDAFKPQEWIPRITVLGGVILSIFGLGSFLQPNENSLNITAKQISEPRASRALETSNNQRQSSEIPVRQLSTNSKNLETLEKQTPNLNKVNLKASRESVETTKSEVEAAYFCGAATKKGNPCSRRVKGNTRCWQHAGQPAVLSPEKLLTNR